MIKIKTIFLIMMITIFSSMTTSYFYNANKNYQEDNQLALSGEYIKDKKEELSYLVNLHRAKSLTNSTARELELIEVEKIRLKIVSPPYNLDKFDYYFNYKNTFFGFYYSLLAIIGFIFSIGIALDLIQNIKERKNRHLEIMANKQKIIEPI